MTDQSNPHSEEQKPVEFPREYEMIKAYRQKMKVLSEQKMTLPTQHMVNLEGEKPEHLAIVLDRPKLLKVLEQKGCDALVAFFALERDDASNTTSNTLVIMGLDKDLKLLPGDHGMFSEVQETWSKKISLTSEEELEQFFRESIQPKK